MQCSTNCVPVGCAECAIVVVLVHATISTVAFADGKTVHCLQLASKR